MFYKTLQTSLSIGRNLSKKFERLSREERFYVLKRTKLTIISFTFKYTKVSYNLSSWCNNQLEITSQIQCNVVKSLELSVFLHFAISNFITTTKRVQHLAEQQDRLSSQYNRILKVISG